MRRIVTLVWNADEADAGILLFTWGIAFIWVPNSASTIVIGLSAIIVGIAKIVLASSRLGKLPKLKELRVGLPVIAMMIWLGACLNSVFQGVESGWGGWSSVIYLWLSYRAIKSFGRLLTKYASDLEAREEIKDS